MATAREVHYPDDMLWEARAEPAHWAESTIHSAVGCIEDYAQCETTGVWPVDFRNRVRAGLEAQALVSRSAARRLERISDTFS